MRTLELGQMSEYMEEHIKDWEDRNIWYASPKWIEDYEAAMIEYAETITGKKWKDLWKEGLRYKGDD